IMPIVNPWGYDKDNRNNVQGVNINRNFPVLWKGLRDDANMQYYKALGTNPADPTSAGSPPWTGTYTKELSDTDYQQLLTNIPVGIQLKDGIDFCGKSIQKEAQNVQELMKLKVELFLDFHQGQEFQMAYPWGFWPQTTTPTTAPGSAVPLNRYCNPKF